MVNKKIWMGVGLYQSYLDNIVYYASKLSDYNEIIFLMGDEIQKYNNSLNHASERQRIKESLLQLKEGLEARFENVTLHSWSLVSKNKRYNELFSELKGLYAEETIFRRQVQKISSDRTSVPKENPLINVLSNYTLEELSAIYHFGELGYEKAGPQGERAYDKLAKKSLKRYDLGVSISLENLNFTYL